MVVLRFWTENGIDEIKVEDHPDSMISIAFGAPNICDSKCAHEVNGNDKLKSHFFNVVGEDDPFTSFLDEPREGHDYGDSTARAGKSRTRYPIGEIVHLARRNQHRSSFKMSSRVPTRNKPWTRKEFSDAYKSGVAAAAAGVPGPVVSEDSKPPKLVVSSPAPQVTSAKRKASDSGSSISIREFNLLFLSAPVKLDGLHPWETTMQTDTELMISAPNKTKMDGNALTNVVLMTAFGATEHVVTEVGTLDGASTAVPLRLLSRIVQTFIVLATPPLCYLPPTRVLQDLDGIIQCVQDLKDKKLYTVLKVTAEGGDKLSEEDIRKNIDEMNDVVKAVIESLTRSYIIQQVKKMLPMILGCMAGVLLLAVGLVLLPVGGIAIAAGSASYIAAAVTAVGVATAGGGGGVLAVSLGKGQVMVREYTEMLEIAIYEASLWPGKKKSKKIESLDLDRTSAAALESSLHKEVECSRSYLAEMIETIRKSETKDVTLYSETLKGASLDSKRNLVRRMQIVAKTVDMFNNEEVSGTEFLGLVGAEDAGKSTFIKKAIQKFAAKSDAEVLEVGFKFHTKTVRPYKLKDGLKLYLVDFPGGNGTEKYAEAWKQFTSLPSSCILLIPFMGDIKKDQVKMYKKMKDDLDSKVAVVFNKVDEMFTPRREAEFDAEYF